MSRLPRAAAAAVCALLAGGCVQQRLYAWGDYDAAMYRYARDEAEKPAFQDALLRVIETNETAGKRMPPGIYAEYGYQLLEQNRVEDAVSFFDKEKRTWAESTAFMDTMIAYARGGRQLKKPTAPQPTEAK
ncbi:DUF4810 domain-containing protein [Oleispirillum naphthae]|uniref:DUF4810 domain-containing protein n=1 Tax=Oleispirillum naphthae TaxID=2838853 RepID=UPI0030825F9F